MPTVFAPLEDKPRAGRGVEIITSTFRKNRSFRQIVFTALADEVFIAHAVADHLETPIRRLHARSIPLNG